MTVTIKIPDRPAFTSAQQGQHARILRKMHQADRNASQPCRANRWHRWYHIGLKHNEALIRMEMFAMVAQCVIENPSLRADLQPGTPPPQ